MTGRASAERGGAPHPLQRDVASLAGPTFDLLVIGGGIVGACIARDAARRGLSVALIDRWDFSSGTSAASSKLVHGGVRYLQSFELRLVREALRERRIWARNASHLVQPMPFLLPLGASRLSRAAMGAAIWLYDLLAFDANRLEDPGQRIPRHRRVGAQEAAEREPALAGALAGGAILYFDYHMASPERLGLECVIDAAAHGACVANYVEATGLIREAAGAVRGVRAEDRVGSGGLEIRARAVVNATGAWGDEVAGNLLGEPPPFAIRRSKGIHLVARPFLGRHALALTDGKRHLFALPWRGRTLIGTTDTRFDGPRGAVAVAPGEAAALLCAFKAMVPAARVDADDIVHEYAGVRPLVARGEAGADTYRLSRAAEIVEHGRRGGPANLISAVGGKWTTARFIAERTVDRVEGLLGVRLRPCDTTDARLPLAPSGAFADHQREMERALAPLDAPVRAQLLRSYGTAAAEVVRAAAGDRALLEPIAPDIPHVLAEAVYAARNEMAVTVEDVLLRRTAIAPLGGDGPAMREAVARAIG